MRNLQSIQVRTGSNFETVCPFPVGYIYQSTNSTSPGNIYGGVWTPLTDGKFLRPQGSWDSTGGENEHKLSIAEMPSHSHTLSHMFLANYGGSAAESHASAWAKHSPNDYEVTTTVGGNVAHNNVPAYRTCYCWYRTS